jgi:hypothetical protein
MDRVLLEQELAIAQERITQLEMRIDRKIALIDDLKSSGVATLVEANLLREFRRAHALWVAEWNRLAQQLNDTRNLNGSYEYLDTQLQRAPLSPRRKAQGAG